MEIIATASKLFDFCAAHSLSPGQDADCSNVHGHNYSVTVEVTGPVQVVTGMVMNTRELNEPMDRLLKQGTPEMARWDHSTFIPATDTQAIAFWKSRGWRYVVWEDGETTSENIALYICDYLKRQLADRFSELGITQIGVEVQETQKIRAKVLSVIGE